MYNISKSVGISLTSKFQFKNLFFFKFFSIKFKFYSKDDDNDSMGQVHGNCLTVEVIKIMQIPDSYNKLEFSLSENIQKHSSEYIIKVTLSVIIIVIGLFGNLTVLYNILFKSNNKNVVTRSRYTTPSFRINNNNNNYNKDDSTINNNSSNNNINFKTKLSNPSLINSKTEELDSNLKSKALITHGIQTSPTSKSTTVIYYTSTPKSKNLFILNLCIVDLIIICLCSWVHMINSTYDNWFMGDLFCRLNTFVQIFSLIAAISTLSLISFDRFNGIVRTKREKLTTKQSIIMIILIWIFAFVMALPILMYRRQFTRQWANHVEKWCDDDWPVIYHTFNGTNCVEWIEKRYMKIYYTFISIILFFVPMIIMAICYFFIFQKLHENQIMSFYRKPSKEKNCLNKRKKKVIKKVQ
jgi:hypothetical protein